MSDKDFRTLEQKIRGIMVEKIQPRRNTDARGRQPIVGRPETAPDNTDPRSTLNKHGQIKTKIIDEGDNPGKIKGDVSPVDLKPQTDDRMDVESTDVKKRAFRGPKQEKSVIKEAGLLPMIARGAIKGGNILGWGGMAADALGAYDDYSKEVLPKNRPNVRTGPKKDPREVENMATDTGQAQRGVTTGGGATRAAGIAAERGVPATMSAPPKPVTKYEPPKLDDLTGGADIAGGGMTGGRTAPEVAAPRPSTNIPMPVKPDISKGVQQSIDSDNPGTPAPPEKKAAPAPKPAAKPAPKPAAEQPASQPERKPVPMGGSRGGAGEEDDRYVGSAKSGTREQNIEAMKRSRREAGLEENNNLRGTTDMFSKEELERLQAIEEKLLGEDSNLPSVVPTKRPILPRMARGAWNLGNLGLLGYGGYQAYQDWKGGDKQEPEAPKSAPSSKGSMPSVDPMGNATGMGGTDDDEKKEPENKITVTKPPAAAAPKAAPAPKATPKAAPKADAGDDDLPFATAFARARERAGGGSGQFTWKGKQYQTNIQGKGTAKNPEEPYIPMSKQKKVSTDPIEGGSKYERNQAKRKSTAKASQTRDGGGDDDEVDEQYAFSASEIARLEAIYEAESKKADPLSGIFDKYNAEKGEEDFAREARKAGRKANLERRKEEFRKKLQGNAPKQPTANPPAPKAPPAPGPSAGTSSPKEIDDFLDAAKKKAPGPKVGPEVSAPKAPEGGAPKAPEPPTTGAKPPGGAPKGSVLGKLKGRLGLGLGLAGLVGAGVYALKNKKTDTGTTTGTTPKPEISDPDPYHQGDMKITTSQEGDCDIEDAPDTSTSQKLDTGIKDTVSNKVGTDTGTDTGINPHDATDSLTDTATRTATSTKTIKKTPSPTDTGTPGGGKKPPVALPPTGGKRGGGSTPKKDSGEKSGTWYYEDPNSNIVRAWGNTKDGEAPWKPQGGANKEKFTSPGDKSPGGDLNIHSETPNRGVRGTFFGKDTPPPTEKPAWHPEVSSTSEEKPKKKAMKESYSKEAPMFQSDNKFGSSDSLIAAARAVMEAKYKNEKELAAMGHPKDKITKKDVLIARGVIAKEDLDLEEAAAKGKSSDRFHVRSVDAQGNDRMHGSHDSLAAAIAAAKRIKTDDDIDVVHTTGKKDVIGGHEKIKRYHSVTGSDAGKSFPPGDENYIHPTKGLSYGGSHWMKEDVASPAATKPPAERSQNAPKPAPGTPLPPRRPDSLKQKGDDEDRPNTGMRTFEEVEQVDEVLDTTFKKLAYAWKAEKSRDAARKDYDDNMKVGGKPKRSMGDDHRIIYNRGLGMSRVMRKLKKEETDNNE